MAFRSSYYANNLERNLDEGIPVISQELDSVRQYQFEVTFNPPPGVQFGPFSKPLTVACKKVGALGMAVKPIEVRRVNDVVYYPGQVSYQEVEFTFDNLLSTKTGKQLYDFMTTVFDPTTGEYGTAYKSPRMLACCARQALVLEIRRSGLWPNLSWVVAAEGHQPSDRGEPAAHGSRKV